MGNALMQSLGLGEVSGDINSIPDGKYDGKISKSEYVVVPAKGEVSHVITYKVSEGTNNGAEKQEWFTYGKDPLKADGTPAEKFEEMTRFTPSMPDDRKKWYKKRLLDLGFSDQEISDLDIARLVGIEVTFGVKTKDAWQNVNFAEKRKVAQAPAAGPVDLGAASGVTATAPAGIAPAPAGDVTAGL